MTEGGRSRKCVAAGVGGTLLGVFLLALQIAGPVAARWIPDYVAIPFALVVGLAVGIAGVYFALRSIGDEFDIGRIRRRSRRDRWRAKIGRSDKSTTISYRYPWMIGFLCFAVLLTVVFLLGFLVVPKADETTLSVAAATFCGGGVLLFGSLSYWYSSRLLHRDPAIVLDEEGISHSLMFSRPHRVSWSDVYSAELIDRPIEIVIYRRILTLRQKKKGARSSEPLFGISLLHVDASANELMCLINGYSRRASLEREPANVSAARATARTCSFDPLTLDAAEPESEHDQGVPPSSSATPATYLIPR
jgi:hypothetical protein